MTKPDDQHQDKIAVYYAPNPTVQTVHDIRYVFGCGFDSIYILSSEPTAVVKIINESIGEKQLKGKKYHVITEEIESTADVFRTIDAMSVVSTDFVFLEGDLKTSDPLLPLMEKHKATVKKDKNAILTFIGSYCVPGHPARSEEDEKVLVIDCSKKILAYYHAGSKYFRLPKAATESGPASVRFDLISSGVYICTPKIPALFTENFDFHNMQDLMKHALLEDEVVTSNLYVEEVKGQMLREFRDHFHLSDDLFAVPQMRLPSKVPRFSESASGSESDSTDGDDDEEAAGLDAFSREVYESLERGFKEKLKPNDLILEINGSRYAYNIAADLIGSFVLKAILTLNTHVIGSKEVGAQFEHLKKVLKVLSPVLKNYVSEEKQEAQANCLEAVQKYCNEVPDVIKYAQRLLHQLYEEDVLSSNSIVDWYATIKDSDKDMALSKSIAKFVEWLQEDEESESEEE